MKIRHLLPMAVFLMGTDACSPQLPESDPVLSTDPDAVAALREAHADFLVILAALEAEQNIPIRPDSRYFQPLAQVSSAIPSVSSISAAAILKSAAAILKTEEAPPECTEGDYFIFLLDVMTQKRRLQRPRSQQLEIVLCYEDADTLSTHLRGEPVPAVDAARLGQLLRDSIDLILTDMDVYMEDFEHRQHRILSVHMGCPDGTVYDHNNALQINSSVLEHWCARDGLRHGPYIKGELSPLLDGVRLAEGHFDSGMRDGHWILRDEDGTVTEESWWSSGQQVPTPAAP